ncbi:MAG: 4Fe-4S binding protein [Ruminococcaceae bacterium]|nr:4Fe-4S binding protein [Oscillospiraceae bacterium]
MKQVVLVSGKGGTGKSTIAASLAQMIERKMLADLDVDAPNLHLLLKHDIRHKMDYYGAKVAQINPEKCIACGRCRETCRFAAISPDYIVNPLACEGCAACTVVCPTEAIQLNEVKTGEHYISDTSYGTFAHAKLAIGAEGSGKLVTAVRKSLFDYENGEDLVLLDGSPGIGCVVIASITGTDTVVAVAEPTRSGLHDLKRVLSVASHFRVPACVCINKWDLNPAISDEIADWCTEHHLPVIARFPFDGAVMEALKNNMTPLEAGVPGFTDELKRFWTALQQYLKK